MAGRALVSRPGRRERPFVGPRASDQAANSAGILRAAVHVLSGELERPVPAERGGWRNVDQIPSPGVRTDCRGPSRGSCERLDIYERWRAQTCRSEAPAAVSAAAAGGEMYVSSMHCERRVDYHRDHVHGRADGARREEVACE